MKKKNNSGIYVSIVGDAEHVIESVMLVTSVLAHIAFAIAIVTGGWA